MKAGTNVHLQCVQIYGVEYICNVSNSLVIILAVLGKWEWLYMYRTQISNLASAFSIGFFCRHVGMQFPSTLVHWQPWHLNCRQACCTDTKIPWTHTTLLERQPRWSASMRWPIQTVGTADISGGTTFRLYRCRMFRQLMITSVSKHHCIPPVWLIYSTSWCNLTVTLALYMQLFFCCRPCQW